MDLHIDVMIRSSQQRPRIAKENEKRLLQLCLVCKKKNKKKCFYVIGPQEGKLVKGSLDKQNRTHRKDGRYCEHSGSKEQRAGLPDGLFSNQNCLFWVKLGRPWNGKCCCILFTFVM
jgi:hypothetical protein